MKDRAIADVRLMDNDMRRERNVRWAQTTTTTKNNILRRRLRLQRDRDGRRFAWPPRQLLTLALSSPLLLLSLSFTVERLESLAIDNVEVDLLISMLDYLYHKPRICG